MVFSAYKELPGLLPDHEIRRVFGETGRISPFVECQKSEGKISYGLSSAGYDLRLGTHFRLFTPTNCAIVDPKNFDPKAFVEVDVTPKVHNFVKNFSDMRSPRTWKCVNCDMEVPHSDLNPAPHGDRCPKAAQPPDFILIPPNSFCLGETVETLDMPREIMGIVLGKSTMARCGLICNFTPIEAGWRGKITIEISNSTPLPAKVYPNEGIAQILFFRTTAPCEVSYGDRAGKYQDQKGVTLPTVIKEEKHDPYPE